MKLLIATFRRRGSDIRFLRPHAFHLACILLLAGCADARLLMPTPSVYADESATLFGELPEEYVDTHVQLIYVTDRAPETDANGKTVYGFGRSASLAAGTTMVDLGHNLTWDDLVKASITHTRFNDFELRLVSTNEIERLPPTPIPFDLVDGEVVEDPVALALLGGAGAEHLEAEIRRRLALTPRKDVFIYIHGYNNTFDDAAFALAELWHFLGREGLPIVYTWPAGHPGIFGYTYDR